MNNKITNPYLKQLISEISNKTSEGRFGVSWGVLSEAKTVKKEAKPAKKAGGLPELPDEPAGGEGEGDEKQPGQTPPLPENPPAKDAKAAGLGDVPSTEQSQPPAAPTEAPATDTQEAPSEEDVKQAEKDAVQKKAELEKVKADTDKAEEEILKHSYVKLNTPAGTAYMLSKIVTKAHKMDTIDQLAGEMVDKLKIDTQEKYAVFANDMTRYRKIEGMPELIQSVGDLIGESPKTSPEGEQPSSETPEA